MKLLGAVLAGGLATRFGSDKAMAVLHGQPLMAHAARVIAGSVDAMIVCGREGAALGVEGVPDRPGPGLGPLGGICGALSHATDRGFDTVLTIGCDTPFVPSDLIAQLVAGPGARFVRQLPILGYWPAHLFASLEAHLRNGGVRSVMRWTAMVGASSVDAGGALINVNRPDDLHDCATEAAVPNLNQLTACS